MTVTDPTKAEHLEWCRQRAEEWLAYGDVPNAVTKFMSDYDQHPECNIEVYSPILAMATKALYDNDPAIAREFIEKEVHDDLSQDNLRLGS